MALFRVDTVSLMSIRSMLIAMEDELDYCARQLQSSMVDIPTEDSRAMNQCKQELQQYYLRCIELSDKFDRLSIALRKVVSHIESTEDRLVAMVKNGDFD